MTEDATKFAIEMYNYHGQLGLKRTDLQHCSVIRDEANPEVWDSNKVFAIRANSKDEISEMMWEVDDFFDPLPYRHFVVDPLAPEPFTAYLAFNDYSEYAVILQMILTGPLKTRSALNEASIRPVVSEDDWATLHSLVLIDHEEGARTKSSISKAVTDGIVAGYRAKAEQCQFFLVELDGQHCAYGSGVSGPNGMGMVEDIFTLPEFRGRGVASKVIDHCVEFCRERGANHILIGSHSNEPPKHLYNKLGFKPAFLTRNHIKQS